MHEELENLFSSVGLNSPTWLGNIVDSVQRERLTAKSARHSVYRQIWTKIKNSKRVALPKSVVYPKELVQCMNAIFPGEEHHKDVSWITPACITGSRPTPPQDISTLLSSWRSNPGNSHTFTSTHTKSSRKLAEHLL
ncbi:uncharacterized protein LOC129591751 [Paramacrobiotus metropolitanus]|uniref:uncharacterized protein LOC129591751 n=1 Tax=Paramacrobiotus metropolitanus TaxID=2943436 RepID=UPI002445CD48|nr:uncharacterized protein LOC129591751 [Paramacrobiotus metropolitanus]